MKHKLEVTPKERIILIRKGNELFNRGDVETAKKIFITTAYKDGLIRIGDYYLYQKKQPLTALELYIKAEYRERISQLSEKMAEVIKNWIRK